MTVIWFVDTETGGTDEQIHSILSVAVVRWEDRKITDQYACFIEENPMVLARDAMEKNQIDVRQRLGWKTPQDAAKAIARWVFCAQSSKEYSERPLIGGHNVAFDVKFIGRLFKIAGERYPFSYRTVDTASIARYLHTLGLLNPKSFRLEDLCAELGVKHTNAHTAIGDVLATVAVFEKMQDLVLNLKA
jgi:DNA polymerase-3 subunit epsilon